MPNEYDDLVKNAPLGNSTEDSGYGVLINDADTETKQKMQISVGSAVGKNPDTAAQVIDLSKRTKIPAEIIERNFDTVKQKANADHDYDALVKDSPALSKWLTDPTNASVAHDDIDNLKAVEGTTKDYTLMSELGSALNVGLANLNSSIAKSPAFLADVALLPGNLLAKAIGREDLQSKSPDWLLNNPVAKFYDEQAQKYQTPAMSESIVEHIAKGNYGAAGRALAVQFTANAPQQAAMLAAMFSGLGEASLIATGITTGATANSEARAEGKSPIQSTTNAILQGTIESAFESLGTFGILHHWEGEMSKQFGKGVSKEVMAAYAKTIAYSVAGEANEEFLTSLAQDYASYATGVNERAGEGSLGRALNAGIVGGFSGGTLTSATGALSAAHRGSGVREAALAKDFYTNFGDSIDKVKLKDRSPEALRSYVESMTKGTPVENVYIPVAAFDTYFQKKGVNPVQIAQELGVSKSLEEAKQTGGDVQIPLASLVGNEHYKGLANDVKFKPEAMTGTEAVEDKAKIAEEVKAASAQAEQQQQQQAAPGVEQGVRSVVSDVAAQLKTAGVDPKQAELLRGIAVLAEREGKDPLQFYKDLNINIGTGSDGAVPGEGQTFDQAAASPGVLKNPYYVSSELLGQEDQLRDNAMKAGYDGIIFKNAQGENVGTVPFANPAASPYVGMNPGAGKFFTGPDGKVYNQAATVPPMFSKLQQTIEQKVGNTATVEQVRGVMRDLKPEEIKWSGIDEFLKGKEKVSKAELMDFLRANQLQVHEVTKGQFSSVDDIRKKIAALDAEPDKNRNALWEAQRDSLFKELEQDSRGSTKFSQYVLPGGENYKEILFTLPTDKEAVAQKMFGKSFDSLSSEENTAALQTLQSQNYTSSHFNEGNVIAHTRINERTDSEGKRVLFVEEVQSDLHQTGRKYGYKSSENAAQEDRLFAAKKEYKVLSSKINDATNAVVKDGVSWDKAKQAAIKSGEITQADLDKAQALREEVGALTALDKGVPDAPFKKTWHEFVMKRLIRMAAEQGMDKVAWTTGEQQADRYDLSKQVDEVKAKKNKDGTYAVKVIKDGEALHEMASIAEADLEAQLGKDLAAKIVADGSGRSKSYKGVDLKVGGEGMKGFYDKILVDFANKFGKKFDAKVGETQLGEAASKWSVFDTSENKAMVQADSKEEAESIIRDTFKNDPTLEARPGDLSGSVDSVKVHSLELTPELKNAALNEGFSMFQKDDQTPKGQIRIGEKSINIDLLEKADSSTFIHETGHLYLEVLGRLANEETATAETKQDMKTVLDWFGVESADQITTEHHEQFARGFEKYIGEGVAPSSALKQAFNRFKIWILSVYGNLKNLNVNLTPEVRDVFDRMLASKEEIDKAEIKMNYTPLFENAASVGMNAQQTERYHRAAQEARQFAESEINRKLMADFKKKQTAEYTRQRDLIKEKITAQANELPTYKALAYLKDHTNSDGTPLPEGTPEMKIDRAFLMADDAKAMPRGILSDEGVHPDVAAEILGFPSGQNLLDNMKHLPPKEQLVNRTADTQMAEIFPDLKTDGQLPEEALKAVHNEKRTQMLRMELEHLASQNLPALKDVIRKTARRVPTQAVVREQAEALISGKTVAELTPYIYQRAEVKAAREAGEFLAKGDIDAAFESKKRELLNHELFKAASEASEQVDKTVEKFKKIFRSNEDVSKVRDTDLVNAARSVLSLYGLTNTPEKSADDYLKQIKQYDTDTYNVMKVLVDSASDGAGNYRGVTYDKFSDMADAVNALWDLAKTSKEIQIDGKRVSRETMQGELTAKIAQYAEPGAKLGYDKAVSKWDKTKMLLLAAKAALTRVEHWADTMDVEKNGPFKRIIWNPVSEAITQYRLKKSDVLKNFESILREHAPNITREEIKAPEIGYTFKDKTELLMALLHTGNESNMDKLLRGRGWGTVQEDGTTDKSRWQQFTDRLHDQGVLTKADYDFAQKVWNLMDSLKGEAQKSHKEMYGYYFNEITAREIQTPFGNYEGGYIPAKVDVYTNEDAAIRQEREDFEKNNNSYQFPTTGRGFTKSRVDAYAAPLSLELSLLGGHIDNVLRFTHIEPRVKEVARIAMNKEFRASLATVDPTIAKEMLIPWLQRAATQKVVLPSESGEGKLVDAAAKFLRKSVAMQIMVGNVTNTLQQFTGMVVAMSKVDPKFIRNGLISYIRDVKGTTNSIFEKSDYMKSTQGTNIYETQQAVHEIIVNPTVFQKVQDFSLKHTYFLQSATQNIVNTVVWSGAYEQAVGQGVSEVEAVREADSAVRLTQGTNSPEDISRFETGTATKRLFTQFAGYFNMLTNLNAGEMTKISKELGLRKGAGKMFYTYLTAFMIPAVLSEFLVKAMSGKKLDEDDDGYANDLLSTFFGSQFKTLTAMIPWGGQLLTAGYNRFNKQQYDDRLSLSPVLSTLEGAVGVPAEIYKKFNDGSGSNKVITRDVLTLMGTMSSLPLGPISRPANYLQDVSSGDARPTGPIDFTRGLVTGKKGK